MRVSSLATTPATAFTPDSAGRASATSATYHQKLGASAANTVSPSPMTESATSTRCRPRRSAIAATGRAASDVSRMSASASPTVVAGSPIWDVRSVPLPTSPNAPATSPMTAVTPNCAIPEPMDRPETARMGVVSQPGLRSSRFTPRLAASRPHQILSGSVHVGR